MLNVKKIILKKYYQKIPFWGLYWFFRPIEINLSCRDASFKYPYDFISSDDFLDRKSWITPSWIVQYSKWCPVLSLKKADITLTRKNGHNFGLISLKYLFLKIGLIFNYLSVLSKVSDVNQCLEKSDQLNHYFIVLYQYFMKKKLFWFSKKNVHYLMIADLLTTELRT